MRTWFSVQHWIHDNIAFIFFFAVIGMFVAAWLIAEAFRSNRGRDEMFRLRQRLYVLERESNAVRSFDTGPVVLPSRWVGVGSAATTSDGGCLILVEAASPLQRRAMMTVRVDGLPVRRNQSLQTGHRLEVSGKSGTYTIELHATDTAQARLAVSLRTLHVEPASEEEA